MSTNITDLNALSQSPQWVIDEGITADTEFGGIETPLSGARPSTDNSTNYLQTLQQELENSATQLPTLPGGFGASVSPSGAVTTTGMGTSSTGQASSSTGWIAQFEAWLTSKSLEWVAVVVGIVLIAGAVFGFRELQTTVIQGVKKGATIAAA